MRVLVIGGTVFIGPAVVRQLAHSGHAVAVFQLVRRNGDAFDSLPHPLIIDSTLG